MIIVTSVGGSRISKNGLELVPKKSNRIVNPNESQLKSNEVASHSRARPCHASTPIDELLGSPVLATINFCNCWKEPFHLKVSALASNDILSVLPNNQSRHHSWHAFMKRVQVSVFIVRRSYTVELPFDARRYENESFLAGSNDVSSD